MRKFTPRAFPLVASVLGLALLTSWSCGIDENTTAPVTPDTIKAMFVQKLDNIPGLAAALQRTLATLGGDPQPGVNIVPTDTGGSFTVGVDLDGDGVQESNVTGTLTYLDANVGIAGGAVLQITELTGNTVQLTTTIVPGGPTQAYFSEITANVPAEGHRAQVVVDSGQITVDVSTSPPTLSGYASFAVGDVSAYMVLSTDGVGNLVVTVTGENFTFTLPESGSRR
jgi:hypothetical protein